MKQTSGLMSSREDGFVRNTLTPAAIATVLKGLYSTLRVRHCESEAIDAMNEVDARYILTFWHNDGPYSIFSRLALPIVPLISTHRDGELIANVMRRFGVTGFARGSSTRGGASGLREIVRWGRSGVNLAISPDGPKGPIYDVKTGVVTIARLTGLPVMPMRFQAERQRELDRTWDHARLAVPFTRAIFLYGEPMSLERDADDAEQELFRKRIENVLEAMRHRAVDEFDTLWRNGQKGRGRKR